VDRDELRAHLTVAGIGTEIHYPIPPHRSEAYARLGHRAGAFPVAERLAAEVLSLPIGPQLDAAGAEAVIDAVRAWCPAVAVAA
jgi:dTDP-4-amino-4,6-dideoxygalactose transaminase